MAMGLTERIQAVMSVAPKQSALEYKGHWHSWEEVSQLMQSLEVAAQKANLGEGEQIGVLLRNRPAHVAALLQIIASRRCVVTLNPFQPPAKIAKELRELRLPLLVADEEDLQQPAIQEAVEATGTQTLDVSSSDGKLTLTAIERQGSARDYAEPLPGTCVLMLTSGTTGPAKRIKLPYRNFERSLLDAAHYQSKKDGDRLEVKETPTILCTPLVHIGGMYASMMSMISARPLSILEKFSVDEWQNVVVKYRPKMVMLPPTALRMILDAGVPREALSSLLAIRTGSSPLPPELQDAFEETYGVPLLDVYGATEFAGAVAGWTIKDHRRFKKEKRGSVGRAQPGCELRIVDRESGEPQPAGTVGLLEVKSVQVDPTRWIRTNDLGELDEDGFLYIRGRADDAITRGGFKVLPREVESVLREHPSVKEAAVVGLPDARLGAVPVAAVELYPEAKASADDLMGFVKEKLVKYQVPISITIMDSLPRTPSMKVSQYELKDMLAKKNNVAPTA